MYSYLFRIFVIDSDQGGNFVCKYQRQINSRDHSTMTEKRKRFLSQLVGCHAGLDEVGQHLQTFPWDSETELVSLKANDLAGVLQRFLRGELTSAEVERWSNLIEGRDDIGFEERRIEAVRDVLFELANPLLTMKLTRDRAYQLLKLLAE